MIDPYADYDEELDFYSEAKRSTKINTAFAGLTFGPSVIFGGLQTMDDNAVGLALPACLMALSGLQAFRIHRRFRRAEREWNAIHVVTESQELLALARILHELPPHRREVFRDLWDQSLEMAREPIGVEVMEFLQKAYNEVKKAQEAHEKLDSFLEADPHAALEASEEVQVRFALPEAAEAALLEARRYVDAVDAVTSDFTSRSAID